MKVNVTIEENANIDNVAILLVQKGFVVHSVLNAIGIITGDCRLDLMPDLLQVEGVSAVEEEKEMTATGRMTEHGLSHGDFMGMSLPGMSLPGMSLPSVG